MPGLLTDEERRLRARLAAHERHAKTDPLESTAVARETFWQSFLDQIDPALPELERERRARHLRKAYLARLEYFRLRAQSAADKTDG